MHPIVTQAARLEERATCLWGLRAIQTLVQIAAPKDIIGPPATLLKGPLYWYRVLATRF